MNKILSLSAIILLLAILSCSKSTDSLPATEFNIKEAQAAFINNYNTVLSTKSTEVIYYSLAGGDYTPIWNKSKSNENEYIWSLEVPIISDLQIVLKNKRTGIITPAERRLLFIKNKYSQVISSFIMVSTLEDTKSSNSNFEHLAENSSYSGFVLYSTLAGEFVNLRSYDNGTETANINAADIFCDECDSTECAEGYNHIHAIDETMEDNEFGIMPLGAGGGEYYEGFCIGCGAPYPECWCNSLPVLCLQCGDNYLTCPCDKIICDKCGKIIVSGGVSGIQCDCDMIKEEIWCDECDSYHVLNNCKYYCTGCGNHITQCQCK